MKSIFPILFIDCGDTLCDESTEVRDVPGGVVKQASLFPGAEDALREIHAMGVPIVLVADGLEDSFAYILRHVRTVFDGWVTSETVGEEKPSARMFEAAMKELSLKEIDKPRILMVGNNTRKDIAGANRFGITSVLADYSPRYDMTPHAPEQEPDYLLHDIRELPTLIRSLTLPYRELTKEDDAALAALIRDNLKAHKLDIPGTVYFDDGLDHLSDFYQKDGRKYFVFLGEKNEVIGGIGLAEFPPFDRCAELQKLYLDDSVKGNGLGYEMIRLVEEEAYRLGYRQMYLETHTNLEAAIHIYERAGYQEIARPQGVVHGAMNRFYRKEYLIQ